MRRAISLVLFVLVLGAYFENRASAQVPVPIGPTITITTAKYSWAPGNTLVVPYFDGTVSNAQTYTWIEVKRNVNGAWALVGNTNLVVAGDGSGSWKISQGLVQQDVDSTFRVFMKKAAGDADNAATTITKDVNITKIPPP